MDINETEILIKIRIGNSLNSKLLNAGDTYYLNMKRNSFVCEVLDELYKNFSGESLCEIKKHRIYTKNMITNQFTIFLKIKRMLFIKKMGTLQCPLKLT